MNKKVLILAGDGVNCEHETARAFSDAGGEVVIRHVNDFLNEPNQLLEYKVFCIPGGFSFGDELRSGKILAEKLRAHALAPFLQFTKNGGLTLGICNGFQVLIQLGVFGPEADRRQVTLAVNDHGQFLNQWVELNLQEASASSPWFAGMNGRLAMPMRHKEGRILLAKSTNPREVRIALTYDKDVNGSYQQAAALLDSSGQILGIMPHPEAATHGFLNALSLSSVQAEENASQIRKLFANAVGANS